MTKKIFTFALSAGFAISALSSSHAMESQAVYQEEIITHTPATISSKFFGSLAGGYSSVRGSEFSKNLGGSQIAAGALLSLYSRRFVIDTGAGWLMNTIDGTLTSGQDLSVRTRAAYAELSPRYRLGERWQLGLVGNLLFGTDVKFGPADEGNSFSFLGGLKAAYELPLKNWDLRLVSQFTTDLGIANRQVYVGMAGVQFGLPFDNNSREIRTALNKDSLSSSQAAPVPPAKITFEAHKFHFATNSDELRPQAKVFIQEVASLLQSNPNWEGLEIRGHTDQRGSQKLNQKLSLKRAQSVRRALIKAGIPENKITAVGFGKERPFIDATSREAYAKNRRVELVIQNATDIEKLQAALNKISAK